jgi:hypothetical protein
MNKCFLLVLSLILIFNYISFAQDELMKNH